MSQLFSLFWISFFFIWLFYALKLWKNFLVFKGVIFLASNYQFSNGFWGERFLDTFPKLIMFFDLRPFSLAATNAYIHEQQTQVETVSKGNNHIITEEINVSNIKTSSIGHGFSESDILQQEIRISKDFNLLAIQW